MREEFEKLPEIRATLKKGVFEYTDFTKSYNFIDAMTCINARPSQHKDHGYINGAWRAYQEQQKKLQTVYDDCTEYTTVSDLLDSIKDILK